MTGKSDIRAEAARLQAVLGARGAVPVEAPVLLPSDTLIDLYGEDIRARAYVTSDPLRGEQMLRPDFTVPVTQMHLESGEKTGRYSYAGEVFRRQDDDETRASEYFQVGYEVFGGADRAADEAEVFAAIEAALKGLRLRAAMGDIGFLLAAIDGLDTPVRRRDALRRHLWRPSRFRALLDRFSQPAAAPDFAHVDAPLIGLRSAAEIEARIAALQAETETPPLTQAEMARLDAILAVKDRAPKALATLRAIAGTDAGLNAAADGLAARLQALSDLGVDVDRLDFEASYGRTNLEYYDGFVFGFYAEGRDDLPPVATGGRYDALCARLGDAVAAVGGVIRPDILLDLKAAA